MTTRTLVLQAVAGLAAATLSLLAHAAFVWNLDGQAPLRIDVDAATAGTAGVSGPVDAFVPLEDGGAWLRRGAELIGLTPDLGVAARTTAVASGSMHWDPQSRQLWVAAERDLLRYDGALRLLGVTRLDADIRGLAGSGPDAIWVATDTQLSRVRGDGGTAESVGLPALGGVRGILADAARARVWVVGTSGAIVSLDVAHELRHGPARGALSPVARAVTVDAATGSLLEHVEGRWRSVGAAVDAAPVAETRATASSTSLGVVRFADRDDRAAASLAVAVPVVFVGADVGRGWHWMPAERVSLSLGVPAIVATSAGLRMRMDLEARCGEATCTGAEALMRATHAEVLVAGQPREAAVREQDGRWFVDVDASGGFAGEDRGIDVALSDAFGNRSRFERGAPVDVPSSRRAVPKAMPVVSITSPASGATFVAPASITISAAASVTGATLTKVEFYRDGVLLATDTTSPYGYVWAGVAAGTYALAAKAYDSAGGVATSTAVTVIVNRPPTVSITAPANNAVLVAPVNLTVSASASDADGTIAKVEFLRNGTVVATDTTAPYSYAWNGVPLGTHSLAARATDNRGAAATSAPVSFTVNANVAPTVTITSPAPGARFVYPASVPMAATAADSDGTISRVEFHYDYGLLGSDASSPYSYTWNSPYTGTFSITARAVDNKGAVTASSPVSITIDHNQAPAVDLTGDPPAGRLVTAVPPTFRLTANAADTDGTVASVRFLRHDPATDTYVEFAAVTQPPFAATYAAITLDSEYRFRAEATDNGGAVGAADIEYVIVANRSPQVGLVEPGAEVEWSGFVAPATIVVVVEATELDPSPDRIVRVDVLADGANIASLTAPAGDKGEFVHVWRNVPAGSHSVVVRATDAFGAVGEWSRTVKVVDTSRPASIAIVQPASGQVHGDPVPLQVDLVAGAVPIAQVDYLNAQGRKVASSTTAPFSATWAAPSAGRHAVTAVAVQADGVAVTSPTVFFDVAATGTKGPPLVVLTAPTALASLDASVPITVAADALADRGASISKVEFFSNGVLIGTAMAAPYRIAWSGAPAGTATLTARATDSTAPAANSTGTSSPITVTLGSANPPPLVALSAPASGATYAAPASIFLSATASDSNGTVAKVEFLAGGSLIGTDTTAPYAFTWSNVPAGTYTLTARATDNGGAAAVSAARTINVVANAPPQVALTSPAAGQSFAYGAPIPLAATASDADGTVAKVEFFAGTTRLATDSASPYAFSWSNAAVGTHAITARASDNLGTVTTSAPASVTVTANALPTVSLALPRSGQRFVTGQTINVVATAADSDGGIARVEFLSGTTVIGTATATPYAFAWTGVSTGTYTLYARAVDNRGAVRTSTGVTFSVAPLAVTVDSPVEGAQIAASSVLVSGTFAAPANSGVVVNGVRARVHGNQFFASDVSLAEGPNALAVVVVTPDERALSATRNVTRAGNAPIRVYAEPESGYAPHGATIRIDNPAGVVIASARFESLGSATLDTTGADQQVLGKLTLASAGIATPTVVVTDAAGNVHRQRIGVVAESKSSVDALLKEAWNTHAAALAAGRVDLALATLPPVTAARYKPILEPLAPHFATIVPTWSAPVTGRIADDVGEYTIGRAIDGQNRLFFIYFVRDDRGIWRLDSM